MYIQRLLQQKISQYISSPEIIAVIGPRRCGKTTLLHHIAGTLHDAHFVDFTDRELLHLFNNDIKSFAKLHFEPYKYLIIDEIQYSSVAGQQLKYLYDTYIGKKIIISGSSAAEISIHAIKYLSGRIFLFYLHPLNFEEYLSYKDNNLYQQLYKSIYSSLSFPDVHISQDEVRQISAIHPSINPYYQEFITYGGYPRVVLASSNEEKIEVLKNIYNTYFLKEIKEVLQIFDEDRLVRLLKALALQVGQLVQYNELSQIIQANYKQTKQYLSILEKTFVIKTVLPFFSNKRLELTKNPKVYFIDNGFRNIAIGNFDAKENRVDKGALQENFVFSELEKQGLAPKYWRTKSKAEVDFVLEMAQKLIPIEVKSVANPGSIGKSFIQFLKKYPFQSAVIINDTYFGISSRNDKRIYFLPPWVL